MDMSADAREDDTSDVPRNGKRQTLSPEVKLKEVERQLQKCRAAYLRELCAWRDAWRASQYPSKRWSSFEEEVRAVVKRDVKPRLVDGAPPLFFDPLEGESDELR